MEGSLEGSHGDRVHAGDGVGGRGGLHHYQGLNSKRLKELEKQNATLKRLLAEAELEKAALKELAEGNF